MHRKWQMKDIISWTKFGDLLHAGIQNQFTPAAEQIGCKKMIINYQSYNGRKFTENVYSLNFNFFKSRFDPL